MNKKLKLTSAILSASLLVTPISAIMYQNDNVAKAEEIKFNLASNFDNNLNIDNNIKPMYDGWASANGAHYTHYISNYQLIHSNTQQYADALTSAWFSIMSSAITLTGGQALVFGGASAIISSLLFKNHYFENSKKTALIYGKGILVRVKFRYKKNYYNQLIPDIPEYTYQVV